MRRKRGTQNQAIGRSRGGLTTKILALVDALGNLIRFILMPGQRHDVVDAEKLLDDLDYEGVIADKAFDSDNLRQRISGDGAGAVIPPRKNRKEKPEYDGDIYKWRHLVENYFCKIKEFRRIATRYDKTDSSYTGFLNLVATVLLTR